MSEFINYFEKRVNMSDVKFYRVAALLVVEDKIYIGHNHNDCIEFMLAAEDDSVISKIEKEIYDGSYSKQYSMCEISNNEVLVLDQDSIKVDIIRNTLLSYCQRIKYDLYVVPKIKDYNYLIKLN